MVRPISKIFGFGYKWLGKPVLFAIHPDRAHEMLVSVSRFLQKFWVYRALVSWAWAYKNPKVLGQEICGIKFVNPLGLSAGFDTNFELAPTLKSIGFGLMEGGSLTFKPCAGNPHPWFYRLPKSKSIVVNKGLANRGAHAITKIIRKYPRGTFNNFVLNISVAKTNTQASCDDAGAIADYVGSLSVIKKAEVGDIITLNISCPNAYGGEPFNTAPRLEKLLEAVDDVGLDKPIFVKMPSNLAWPEFEKLLDVIARHKIAGVTICNLFKKRDKANLKDPLPDSVRGNLSGKPVFDVSNQLIQKTYQKYGKRFVIIGVGGVFSAEDAYTKIKLGASLVEMVTGMIFEGPQIIGQINQRLARLIAQDGYSNISEAVGASNR
jgi:dihydroorotate dehydrogenase